MLVVGGLILAFPLWSGLYTSWQQSRLTDAYAQRSTSFAASQGLSQDARPSHGLADEVVVRRLARLYGDELEPGDPVGRLTIPRIGVDEVVQQGAAGQASLDPAVDKELLRNGPVHYGITPLPGAGEPFAVSGHRTTYGAPFSRLDALRRGDKLYVETPYARFEYEVGKTTVVLPTDVTVLADRGYGLVLTTCTPRYSASHRLIVWGKLAGVTIKGAGAPAHD